jgi:hypothetical protein
VACGPAVKHGADEVVDKGPRVAWGVHGGGFELVLDAGCRCV